MAAMAIVGSRPCAEPRAEFVDADVNFPTLGRAIFLTFEFPVIGRWWISGPDLVWDTGLSQRQDVLKKIDKFVVCVCDVVPFLCATVFAEASSIAIRKGCQNGQ